MSQRGEEDVADGMSVNSRALIQPVLQQILEVRVALDKREQAVARIARRQHTKLLAQSPRAAAIVGDRDDPGKRARIPFALFCREL